MSARGYSHIGRREENQDRWKILFSDDRTEFCLAVADGLGGHAGGALAAETVIETVESCWNARAAGSDPSEYLARVVRECHRAVNRKRDETGLDPRSTIVLLLGDRTGLTSIHAGDSRLMQFDGGSMVRRTVDHTVAQLQLLLGAITEEQFRTHPAKNRLTTHIGGEAAPDAEIETWDIGEGNRFVLCSDGFWEAFSTDEIVDILNSADRIEVLSTRFQAKLEHLHKQDNTTAILADVSAAAGEEQRVGCISHWAVACGSALLSCLLFNVPALAGSDHGSMKLPSIGGGVLGAPDREIPEERLGVFGLMAQVIDQEGRERSPADSGPGEGDGQRGSEGRSQVESGDRVPETPSGAVPGLERTVLEPNREVGNLEDVTRVVEEELRRIGGIGEDDAFVPADDGTRLGEAVLTRHRQEHKGVPVFAAEVTAIELDGRITKIQGHPAAQIDIDTRPANDYLATVALASDRMQHPIDRLDDGVLVVFAAGPRTYRLAWKGAVQIDRGGETVLFDSETGEILLRVPLAVGSRPLASRILGESGPR